MTRSRTRFFALVLVSVVPLSSLALPGCLAAQGPALWGAPVNVSGSGVDSWRPAIVLDEAGNIHVVWYDQILGWAEGEIHYASRSPIDGWSVPQRLSSLGGEASRPAVALGPDDTVHVVWQDSTLGESEIRYACRSFDGAWTSARTISGTGGESVRPLVAVGGDGCTHVVWEQRTQGLHSDIYHTCRGSGSLWTAPRNLSQSDADSRSSVLLADGQGTVHVCWQEWEPDNWEIYHTWQPPGGAWGTPRNISGSERDSQDVAIASAGSGAVHVVWCENTLGGLQGDSDIFYARRSPDGRWMPTVENLSNRPGVADSPVIAVDARGRAHVAWQYVKPPGFRDVYAVSRGSDGEWSDPQIVSTFDGNARQPSILAVQDADLVWAGSVQGTWEICHAHWKSDGTWSPAVNISHSVGGSFYPVLVSDDAGALHVVWEDNTPGHYDIHYAGSWAYTVEFPLVCGSNSMP